ncbi:AraC family transcriptional regulator [Clostridium sp. MSJ-11]|uniref:AraC family transcriptional regulator n=1 Tax=Clostridium mobile TaxID=2841512 RepID=A0ABS6EHG7_9CLOT|nr:AraC family transcriptional regulator [Clostridium mobile]MBU5484665.1 AraC family transcriptional regulator [Clostridium mobile]
MFNCFVKTHICNTMKNFFLCTHVPIKAFNCNGTLIHSQGYNKEFEELFNKNDVYKITIDEMQKKEANSMVTTTYLNDISFTAFNICPKYANRGIFIMGPYASNKTNKTNKMDILYKPSTCIPHLISLLRNISADSIYIKKKHHINNAQYNLYVKKSIDYIHNKYSESITLIDISNYLNINRCYFCSIFKKETGKSFSQFLNEVRIEKSKDLLVKGDLSILDVSLSVGFNNQNYYNTVFKKLINMTPLEYRNSFGQLDI